jgi:hypothetical protein
VSQRSPLVSFLVTLVAVAAVFLACAAGTARAQGGPPMVTDDPGTPGNGKWEINLATLGDHSRSGRWEVSAPDADINYGWGDVIQLKVDVPWTFVREEGESWKSGLGTGNVGVKWRFIDGGEGGTSVSTYPQYLSGWSRSSRDRGIVSSDKEFFLPVEVATKTSEWSLDGEVGRNFVNGGDDQWVAGGIVAHECWSKGECLFEVHETSAPHNSQTLLNLGLRWPLSESAILLASAGREFGKSTEEQQTFVFYLGIQLLR